MLAYRLKTVITEDHKVAATLPEDAPPGEAELVVLVDTIPEVDDPEDLAAYRRAMKAHEESGRKTFPIEDVAAELGIRIPDTP